MATRIHILDERVINRIAAGEVVERPVSIVKELLENSIDAGATSIQIDIENGGKKLVRVRDDGSGMGHDDAFLALERHATSKLRSEKDLVGVATMGFRGEALASIASVSKLKLMTSEGTKEGGTEIIIEGGVQRGAKRIGMGRGTVIEVRNLFFNVPVRRKFLKKNQTETAHIHEAVTRFALAHPAVGFNYREDGKVKIAPPPGKSTLDRIRALYSKDVRESLIEVDRSFEEYRIHGYVARPPYAKSNMRSVLTFVNGRSVRDRLINSAIGRAFTNLIERGRYPLAILFLELPPEDVDVNVHPQKAEVRFVRPRDVHELIVDGVHEALTGAPFRAPPGPPEPIWPKPPTDPLHKHLREDPPPREHRRDPEPPEPQRPMELPRPQPSQPAVMGNEPGRFSSLGIVGGIPGSFVVLYDDKELVVMDHHAAHERILFEDLKAAERKGESFEIQDLLIPRLLEYSPVEARALAAQLDLLRAVGFRVEEFGESDFIVKGVPSRFGNPDLEQLFGSLVDVMLNTGVKGDPETLKEELLKDLACKAAVKESSPLQPREIRAILKDLDRIGSLETCPHGRPIVTRFRLDEIRKKLGRK